MLRVNIILIQNYNPQTLENKILNQKEIKRKKEKFLKMRINKNKVIKLGIILTKSKLMYKNNIFILT
jgi:hypothetical protein